MEDFLAANAHGAAQGRLVLVKFYSPKCRVCLRVAAKYRRLAVDLQGSFDFYEVDVNAARALAERLGVAEVPSVQLFDGTDVVRLSSGPFMPKDSKKSKQTTLRFLKVYERHPEWVRRRGERVSIGFSALPI